MISVIIPVFNTEKYLNSCIGSILAQTYTNFELLLVDDGSTDKSGEICDVYATKDYRIHVIHQKNSGTASARYVGIKQAKGEYITFVDSDDELYPNALTTLMCKMSADVGLLVSNAPIDEIISGENYIRYILTWKLTGSLCSRLFRKSLFIDYVQDINRKIIIGEDQLTNIKLVLGRDIKIKCITDSNIYKYRLNPDSVTNTTKFTLEYEEFYMSERIKVLGEFHDIFKDELCYYNLCTLINLIACRVNVSYDRPWIKELLKWGKVRDLGLRGRIVLTVRHNLLCKYLLAIEKRIRMLI
ncbi:glycosyltransferase [Bacteroides sp.]|uniref:glycosyltransferase family 2 protein n=1 Tax=Bacteroides sp. TaxID=29523 RepID=UPI0023BEB119|nr:glycosyltransferase [Bacteroides sp.]MDE6215506.1 glycosyltransferase [Bacteroides sp.]